MESYIELYSGSRNNEHVFYVFHFKRRNQPMKVIIHDLGDAVTYTPEKRVRIRLSCMQTTSMFPARAVSSAGWRTPVFASWRTLQHIGALVGQSDPLIIVSRCCYGGYSSPIKAVLDRAIGGSLPFLPGGAGKLITSAATRAGNWCAFAFTGNTRNLNRR